MATTTDVTAEKLKATMEAFNTTRSVEISAQAEGTESTSATAAFKLPAATAEAPGIGFACKIEGVEGSTSQAAKQSKVDALSNFLHDAAKTTCIAARISFMEPTDVLQPA